MIKSKAQLNLINIFRSERAEKDIWSLTLANNKSYSVEANILSKKSGLSENAIITSYVDEEINSWIGDGADRATGAMYDEVNQQMVAFRADFSYNNNYWYRIDNTTNAATLIATVPYSAVANLGGGTGVSFFNLFNGSFYHAYLLAAGGIGVQVRANNLVGVSVYAAISGSGTAVPAGVALNEETGVFWILDSGNDLLLEVDPVTLTATSHAITGSTIPYRISYISATNEIWIMGDDKLYVMELSGHTVSVEHTGSTGFGSSNMFEKDGFVFSVNYGGIAPILIKWNPSTYQIVSQKPLQAKKIHFLNTNLLLDPKGNLMINVATGTELFDMNGNFLFFYDKNARTVTGGGTGSVSVGNGSDWPLINQRNNPVSGKVFIGGAIGTIYTVNYTYAGGMNEFDITTSACSYGAALRDFKTNPIAITNMVIQYKDGGSSYNNLLEYINETTTGGCTRRVFQPRSFIFAQSGDKKIVEINFYENPLIIDVNHFFKINIPAGEQLTFLLFYKQANKSDVLRNKLLL